MNLTEQGRSGAREEWLCAPTIHTEIVNMEAFGLVEVLSSQRGPQTWHRRISERLEGVLKMKHKHPPMRVCFTSLLNTSIVEIFRWLLVGFGLDAPKQCLEWRAGIVVIYVFAVILPSNYISFSANSMTASFNVRICSRMKTHFFLMYWKVNRT